MSTKLTSSKYCYVLLIIQLNISHLFAFSLNRKKEKKRKKSKERKERRMKGKEERKHMSTKLTGSKYCYVSLTIQLNISHLFAHS